MKLVGRKSEKIILTNALSSEKTFLIREVYE